MTVKAIVQERRKTPRNEFPSRVAINLLQPRGTMLVERINYSDGGVCLRMQEAPEVRSLVRLQWVSEARGSRSGAEKNDRSVEFTGRVAWVIQRMDLRGVPPFLYDVGIEFVDAPPTLRRFVAQRAMRVSSPPRKLSKSRTLPPAVIRGRQYVSRLEREAHLPSPWHLVVSVDGLPCFSGRYASERAALAAYRSFQREQARRK